MSWFLLALLCAFSLASADALTKRWFASTRPLDLMLLRFLPAGLLLSPILLLRPWPELPPPFWGWIALLLPLELAAMWLYLRAICSAPLSHTLPYLAFSPVISALLARLLLGEPITPIGGAGILLVLGGSWLLRYDRVHASGAADWAPLRAMRHETGPRMMLGVALLYGITSVGGKAALGYTGAAFFASLYFTLLGLVILGLVLLRHRRAPPDFMRHPLRALAVGTAMAVMALTHFLAVQQVEVAYMLSVKRTSLLFGILYGAWLFREERLGRHLLAGTVMLSGVVLLAAQA